MTHKRDLTGLGQEGTLACEMKGLRELRERTEKRKSALEGAAAYVKEALVSLGARKVILIGSLAAGKVHRWSDLDLVVVMPRGRGGASWRHELYSVLSPGVAFDLFVYNEDEYAEELKHNGFLAWSVERGKVLHGAD